MKQISGALRRTSFGTVAALFLLTIVGLALPAREASAAGLLFRSLQLSSSAPSTGGTPVGAGEVNAGPGTAANGDKVSHTYIFQVRTTGTIKALNFSYCKTAFAYMELGVGGTCETGNGSLVSGFDATNAPDAKIYVSTGGDFVNTPLTWPAPESPNATFPVVPGSTDVNFLTVANATGQSVTAGQFIKVQFDATQTKYFVNPDSTYSDANSLKTFFAHISTYSDNTAQDSGTLMDEGTVTSAAVDTVSIKTRVQETLKFSIGSDTSDNAPDPQTAACDALSGSANLEMGDAADRALSADRTYDAFSFFRLATNSSKGAKVMYAGETLTSTAGDVIQAVGTTAAGSAHGTEQFGLAISTDSDNNTVESANLTGLKPAAEYGGGLSSIVGSDAAGTYAFDVNSNTTPVVIAESEGVVACNTGVVRYIANISTDTPAGLYSTKISYIAVPSY